MKNSEDRLARLLETIPDARNRATARRFTHERLALGRVPGTVKNQLAHVRDFALILGAIPFEDATKDHVVAYMRQEAVQRRWRLRVKEGPAPVVSRRVEVSRNTTAERAKTMRLFYKWLAGSEAVPPIWSWVKPNRRKAPRLKAEDILTREELDLVLKAARTPRDRALIALLAGTGVRAGEAAALRLRDVEPPTEEDEPALVRLPHGADGLKTGARAVELWDGAGVLCEWIMEHPARAAGDMEAPLFPRFSSAGQGPLTSHGIYDVVVGVAARAGIKKPVFTHALRFAAATHDARRGMHPAVMSVKYGWTPQSGHALYYSRMTTEDVSAFERQKRGKTAKIEAPDGSLIDPVKWSKQKCGRCGFDNRTGASFCARCARPLTVEAEREALKRRDEESKNRVAEIVRREMERVLTELKGERE